MTNTVRDNYTTWAKEYADLNLGALDKVEADREWISALASLAAPLKGTIADLGCGPGHVTNHLAELGFDAVGYDISPGQIAQARQAFPDLSFHLGDLTALGCADSSFGGIVARHSLIHMPPESLDSVFSEFFRMLVPRGPLLVSFFASDSAPAHGTSFDHKVVTAYQMFPGTITKQLEEAGFQIVEVETRSPFDGERPLDHGTILAIRPIA